MNIQTVAQKFQNLFDIRYDFVLGRKGHTIKISLVFEDYNFYHLAGFQYLQYDIVAMDDNAKTVFQNICNGDITDEDIRKGQLYSYIENRLEALEELESLIDSNNLIFKYSFKNNPKSNIKADFVMQSTMSTGAVAYVFMTYTSNQHNLVRCNSIFQYTDFDYTQYQTRLTLLQKTKIRISTGEVLDSYTSKSYDPNK